MLSATHLYFPLKSQLEMSFAAAWLAQLGECWSAGQEITGSNPGQTNP